MAVGDEAGEEFVSAESDTTTDDFESVSENMSPATTSLTPVAETKLEKQRKDLRKNDSKQASAGGSLEKRQASDARSPDRKKGILKSSKSGETAKSPERGTVRLVTTDGIDRDLPKSILKASVEETVETHSILKRPSEEEEMAPRSRSRSLEEPKSILKQRSRSSDTDDVDQQEIQSILVHRRSSGSDIERKSILKSSSPSQTPAPSILKNRSDSLPSSDTQAPVSILKSRSTEDIEEKEKPHSILKHKEPFGHPKTGGILKTSSVEKEESKSEESSSSSSSSSSESESDSESDDEVYCPEKRVEAQREKVVVIAEGEGAAPELASILSLRRERENLTEIDVARVLQSGATAADESEEEVAVRGAGQELIPKLKERQERELLPEELDIDQRIQQSKLAQQASTDIDETEIALTGAGKELAPKLKQRYEVEKTMETADIDIRIQQAKLAKQPNLEVSESELAVSGAGTELAPKLKQRHERAVLPEEEDEIEIKLQEAKAMKSKQQEDEDIKAANPELQPILKKRRDFVQQHLSVDDLDDKLRPRSTSGSGSDSEAALSGASSELAMHLQLRRKREEELLQQQSLSGEENEASCPVDAIVALKKQLHKQHDEEVSNSPSLYGFLESFLYFFKCVNVQYVYRSYHTNPIYFKTKLFKVSLIV